MSKSKYPQQLDTSIEIPPVRDNILEVGSDVINSLRSAIFNIERVLGINPQGAVGLSLSERLNRSLDSNGNIKDEALDRSNLLTGPIIDADVSSVAAIHESKLRLDYPTTLLQDEITILNSNLNEIILQLQELVTEFSIHIAPTALNRHPGTAIAIVGSAAIPSNTAIKNLSNGNTQSTFEDIINEHINYTGNNISDLNNSHLANQIFFDNTNISALIPSNDVQQAIEDLSEVALNSQTEHQNRLHANGILKVGEIDSANNSGIGNILEEDFEISFLKSAGSANDLSTITITTPFPLGDFNLQKSDILTITDASDTALLYIGDYEIESFTVVADNLTSVVIYGHLSANSTSLTFGRISKNTQTEVNVAALLIAAREDATLTSASSIQICNPNSARAISSKIRPYEVTTTNRRLRVAIDGGASVVLDLYSSDASRQSLDTIVRRINEQCSENALGFFAYRLDKENDQSELVLAHNLPDELNDLHTIIISRGSDDGIDAVGFTYLEDQVISSNFGTAYYINGINYESLNKKLDSTDLSFLSSSLIIDTSSSGLDFIAAGIKAQDLITITNAGTSSDNGSYIIEDVSATQISLSLGQLPAGFAGTSQDDTRFRVFSNTASFEDLIFDEVSDTFGAVLADIFLNKNREIFIDKRFEYSTPLLGSNALITLVDFDGEIAEQVFELVISGGTNVATLVLDGGDAVEVRGDNSFVWITSGADNVKLKFMIPSVENLNTEIISSGDDIEIDFFGFAGINDDSNLLLSRMAFNNFNGRLDGGEEAARSISIVSHGNIGINEISSDAIKILVNQPLNDLRSNGVILGLNIANVTTTNDFFTFHLNRGICYIRGKRIELERSVSFITDLDSTSIDKIFIAIDYNGEIKVEACTPICECPFELSEVCLLGALEFDGTTIENIDLRLFINELDLKLLNSITVSPQPGLGHFSELGSAIKYAKRFAEFFPKAGVPTIHLKSGIYEINTEFDNSDLTFSDWNALPASTTDIELYDGLKTAGLIIDFPVNIIGEGDASKLKLRNRYIFSDVTHDFRGFLSIVGDGFTRFTKPIDKFKNGFITLRDFTMENCKIILPDFNITDGVVEFFMGVNIENIVFNMKDFISTPLDTSQGPHCVSLLEKTDTTTDKGNVTISNCVFMVDEETPTKSVIKTPPGTRLKNFTAINSRLLGDTTSSVRLFDQNLLVFDRDGDGLPTNNFNSANITIFGNISGSNFNTETSVSAPDMVIGADGWGDRVSRSLHIGGAVQAGGNLSALDGNFFGEVRSEEFNYDITYTRTKNIFFETLSHTALGNSTSGTSFSTLSVNGREWRTIEFSDNTSDIMSVRLEILPGETLDDLNIVFGTDDPADAIFGGFSVKITSENAFGDETVELGFTSMGVVSGGLGGSSEAAAQGISSLGLEGANNKNYIATFRRSVTTGFDQHMLYIQYTTTVETVQALGGLI